MLNSELLSAEETIRAAAAASVSASGIQISPTVLLTAVPDGRAWLVELEHGGVTALPVSSIAAARASLTASLVEGVVFAGLMQAKEPTTSGAYSLPRYIRWLVGNYLFAGQTPGIFRRGAERFDSLGRPDLAAFSRQKAEEEDGHARLAYRDLEGLGLPAMDVIRLLEPPSARVFADRFRTYAESSTPVALFGFSYCLERMAVWRDHDFIAKVQAACPPNVRAFRFLKVHSNIGADHGHVDEQLAFFETLTEADLTPIICAAYRTAELLALQSVVDADLSDEEIGRRLKHAMIEAPFALP